MSKPLGIVIATIVVLAAVGIAGYFTGDYWRALYHGEKPASAEASTQQTDAAPTGKVLLSDQAITNLGLVAKSVQPRTFWKTIQVPGSVVDRPGQSDRSVIAPVTGVIVKISRFPGDTVRPGEVLFTLKLLSESLHMTQSDLFKATQDIKLAQAQRKRLDASGGAIPEARLIEVDNQLTRLEVGVKAYRRELLNRGFTREQIDEAAEGKFVSEIDITVPKRTAATPSITLVKQSTTGDQSPTFEMQELKAELGQQVQAGQTLCLLANHHLLAIEGRAFRDETSLLERSVKESWPVEADFQEDTTAGWPAFDQTLRIRHMANTIDPVNRTFGFLLPLENQSKVVEQEGRTQILWRFRPGQRLKLLIRVAKLDNVFVLPSEAVTRDGPEAFVFTQNVNTFERRPVRVVFQDRLHAVVANDGSLVPGSFVVQTAAAQLSRMAKSQTSTVPKGYHVHADGSLHKNEDEGK